MYLRPGRRTRAIVYAGALLTTPILHGLTFPPASLHWVAWVALVPWFVALRLASTGGALVLTSVITLAGSYAVAGWLPRGVAMYYGQPLIVGIGFFVGVWIVTVGPWVLVFTVCYRALARRLTTPRGLATLPLLAGAAWTGTELGRVRLLIGDPFGLFGYSQVGIAPMMQIADITGVYGISFLLACVNIGFAELCVSLGMRQLRAGAAAGMLAAAVAVALALGYGVVRLSGDLVQGPSTPVAIVQGNLDLGSQWRQEFYGRNLETYLRLSLTALRDSHPPLLFWPESAMTFFLEDQPAYRASIASVLTPSGAELVAGGPRSVGTDTRPHYYNSGFLISPQGSVLAAYDKQRLLPFAEYFPFGGIELLRREFARVREFTPGGPVTLLPTIAGAAGVVICNEVMFGEIAGERVRAGAVYLVNLTNDSWLGDSQFAAQAFDMARLRAVEQRRYLVRASTSGPSAIVDPFGRVVVHSRSESRDTIVGSVQARTTLTAYGRVGDVFGVLCAIVPLAILLLELAAGRRSRRTASDKILGSRPTNI